MAGSVFTWLTMPMRWATAATLSRPTSSASRAATVLIEWASAVSMVIWPMNSGSKFRGDQPLMVTGSSTTIRSGVRPASMAVV